MIQRMCLNLQGFIGFTPQQYKIHIDMQTCFIYIIYVCDHHGLMRSYVPLVSQRNRSEKLGKQWQRQFQDMQAFGFSLEFQLQQQLFYLKKKKTIESISKLSESICRHDASSNTSLCTSYKRVHSPDIVIMPPSDQKINIDVLTAVQPSDLIQVPLPDVLCRRRVGSEPFPLLQVSAVPFHLSQSLQSSCDFHDLENCYFVQCPLVWVCLISSQFRLGPIFLAGMSPK